MDRSNDLLSRGLLVRIQCGAPIKEFIMWDVKLSIRLMGRSCKNCTQDYIASVAAISAEDAVAKVKEMSGADPDTHKFLVAYVRERK
ncbi:hypothetical protein HOS46_gp22 [Escherichia phage DTL]|uniref:Uncharacterized protein n=1 Tax=Escherichia phage DTL TaxID=2048061 RepID=A0A2H4PGM3_9CAUD|nr:hypothetical protein HOS46_gp22 [Escherichia phage DTL]ATW61799.1 hypothetical protein [Escherichia phage DTL]